METSASQQPLVLVLLMVKLLLLFGQCFTSTALKAEILDLSISSVYGFFSYIVFKCQNHSIVRKVSDPFHSFDSVGRTKL